MAASYSARGALPLPVHELSALPVPLQVVSGYVLERRLGRGAIGDVWLGRHELTLRLAAVKLLPRQLDAQTRALFAVERRAAARLAHPHIVPVFEHGDS